MCEGIWQNKRHRKVCIGGGAKKSPRSVTAVAPKQTSNRRIVIAERSGTESTPRGEICQNLDQPSGHHQGADAIGAVAFSIMLFFCLRGQGNQPTNTTLTWRCNDAAGDRLATPINEPTTINQPLRHRRKKRKIETRDLPVERAADEVGALLGVLGAVAARFHDL